MNLSGVAVHPSPLHHRAPGSVRTCVRPRYRNRRPRGTARRVTLTTVDTTLVPLSQALQQLHHKAILFNRMRVPRRPHLITRAFTSLASLLHLAGMARTCEYECMDKV